MQNSAAADQKSAASAMANERIQALTEFVDVLDVFDAARSDNLSSAFGGFGSGQSVLAFQAARAKINRKLLVVRQYVLEAGALSPVADGKATLDAFNDIFTPAGLLPTCLHAAKDQVQRAIGFYESVASGTLMPMALRREALDLHEAIDRALRHAFVSQLPANEKDVQNIIEVIVAALGLRYTRDTETTAFGGKGFRPDFVLTDLDLALEVKLGTEKHSQRDITEEIAADLTGYSGTWSRMMFVIHDIAHVMNTPEALQEAVRAKCPGASVLVVKQ